MALLANNSTVVGISRAQNQNHEPVAEEGYRASGWNAPAQDTRYPRRERAPEAHHSIYEQIGEEPRGSPELRARTESENASRSSAESIEEEAQNVDDGGDEEEDGGDSGEGREVEGENEVGSGEEEQVEPALSGGIPCPHPLQEIF
jgi:hypothetical protein